MEALIADKKRIRCINYRYPRGYAVKPVSEQVRTLLADFGSIGLSLDVPELAQQKKETTFSPRNAEGMFVFPWWKCLAGSYLGAVSAAVSLLERKIDTDIDIGLLSAIRRSRHTEQALSIISEKQSSNTLVIPAQLGYFFQNIGVKASDESFLNEADSYSGKLIYPDMFGLGVFEVLMILLTHPERLLGQGGNTGCDSDVVEKSLAIDCPADNCIDEIDWRKGREVVRSSPYFFSDYGDSISLGLWPHYLSNISSGIATGFFPRS
ncbi:MAG: hypothetical protein HGB08_01495 [Candidatus Moranbacteria bacterium]|nr:hypothetical protein [Candidatus Moranbacteria bacterium]